MSYYFLIFNTASFFCCPVDLWIDHIYYNKDMRRFFSSTGGSYVGSTFAPNPGLHRMSDEAASRLAAFAQEHAGRIAVVTGAGCSTFSGIPDVSDYLYSFS